MNVIRIGCCSVCQNRAILTNLACKNCRNKFGPRCGHIAQEIRDNPSFRIYVHKIVREQYTQYASEILLMLGRLFGEAPTVRIVE
jgi:hypothetical protein